MSGEGARRTGAPHVNSWPGRVGIEREDGTAQILEGHLVVIRGADAEPRAFDDGARELAEVRSPMDAALDGDEALGARIDAEHAQHVDRGGLDMFREEHDLHPSRVEDHRPAKRRFDARFEAERLVKEPIEIVFTVASTSSGGFGRPSDGRAVLPPIASFTRAPTPAAMACCTACGSWMPKKATSSSSWRRISASTAVVSIVPPEAQLS